MDILIASDIDGTLTDRSRAIPEDVFHYLESLAAKGIELLFVTGRPFKRSLLHLQHLSFPYLLAVYNGSLVFKMPEKEIIHRNYLDSHLLETIGQICPDVVIYGGYEHDDLCYYRPSHFSKELLQFLSHRREYLNETWIEVASFDDVPIRRFPAVKCFGKKGSLDTIRQQLELLDLSVPIITDPVDSTFSVAQITQKEAHKGSVLSLAKEGTKIIACGDDFNDLEMLLAADVAVVMESAPREVLAVADVIAKKDGIIFGIQEALRRIHG